ncbi:MAG: hypothetical protein HDR43_02675 [Mycoplasma sp.]|nr:hypothetical protein [Mycoplasma sp.]
MAWLVIDMEQDVEISELEETLKEVSKKYRGTLYRFGDFQKAIDEYGYMIFSYGRKSDVWHSYFILKENGIFCSVFSNFQFRKFQREQFILKHGSNK